jgi:hypothetical protein
MTGSGRIYTPIQDTIVRQAGFQEGQPVELSRHATSIMVSSAGNPVLTLVQKLALFDPKRYCGEALVNR